MQPRFDQNAYQTPAGPAGFPIALPPDETGAELHTPGQRLLPVLPHTLAEMELLLQEPVVDLGAIAEVAKRDASLSAQLLLLANRDREPDDRFYRIEDCLVQPGISALQELLQETPPLLSSDGRCSALLNHSRLTGVAAAGLALQVPGVDPEKAYLAGLLHLFPELASLETRAAKRGMISPESEEWPLPTFVWDVICWFKHPFAVSGPENLLCEVVLAACEWAGRGTLEQMAESLAGLNSHLTKAP